nr:hypothetical protein [Paenibacillus agri]
MTFTMILSNWVNPVADHSCGLTGISTLSLAARALIVSNPREGLVSMMM